MTTFNDPPLEVYGDESHDERRERVFAVAGLLGDRSDWDAITEKWLARTGSVTFHAADCESQYANHPDRSLHEQNLKLYADLARILAGSTLLGFAGAVELAGWRDVLPPNEPEPPEEMAYYKCFSEVVIFFGRVGYMSIPRRRVHFTFDRSIERQYNAHQVYTYLQRSPDWPGSMSLTDDIASATIETPQIQMADLLAREAMKQLDNEIGPVRRPPRQSMRALSSAGRFRFENYTRDYCARLVASGRRWAESVGISSKAYNEWLAAHRLVDTLAHRIRFHIEFPTLRGQG